MLTATDSRPVDESRTGEAEPRVPAVDARPATLSVSATIRRFAPLVEGLRWRLTLAVICHLVQVGTTVVTVALFAHIGSSDVKVGAFSRA